MFSYAIDDHLALTLPRPAADAQEMFTLIDDNRADLTQWLRFVPRLKVVADEQRILTTMLQAYGNGDALTTIIRLDGRAVGMIGYNHFYASTHSADIGYWLAPAARGQNIMHRALAAMLTIGFQEYDLHKAEVVVLKENEPSNQVALHAGFHLDGRLRAAEYIRGKYRDGNLYSLLQPEWFRKQAQ
jgi:RimJ/RimL family protein N-acetyltransferase